MFSPALGDWTFDVQPSPPIALPPLAEQQWIVAKVDELMHWCDALEGPNAVHLAMLGHRVTAADQSKVGLAKARRLAGKRGVKIETVVANLADYPIATGA
jgi:hypothetical protein